MKTEVEREIYTGIFMAANRKHGLHADMGTPLMVLANGYELWRLPKRLNIGYGVIHPTFIKDARLGKVVKYMIATLGEVAEWDNWRSRFDQGDMDDWGGDV